jgi:hypothetical protein
MGSDTFRRRRERLSLHLEQYSYMHKGTQGKFWYFPGF